MFDYDKEKEFPQGGGGGGGGGGGYGGALKAPPSGSGMEPQKLSLCMFTMDTKFQN